MHTRLIADVEALRDEAEAAAERSGDDVWLERLKVATAEPREHVREPALADSTLARWSKLLGDADLRARIGGLVASVSAKLPGGVAAEGEALISNSILAEARSLALGRAGEG